jgi:hypothetical protein
MKFLKSAAIVGLAVGAMACSQGNSDNVMSPQANALTPAEVNDALGPETNGADLNAMANSLNGTGQSVEKSPATTDVANNAG